MGHTLAIFMLFQFGLCILGLVLEVAKGIVFVPGMVGRLVVPSKLASYHPFPCISAVREDMCVAIIRSDLN